MRVRLEFLAVALAALLFIALAPVFWYSVEAPTPGAAAPGRPHAAMQEEILPATTYIWQRLSRSEWPLWSQEWGGGAPFHAIPAHAAFSPARVLDLGLEPARSLTALAFVNVFLAALAMMLLCRALEVSWAGTLPGATAYAFSGAMAGAMSLPGAGAAYAVGPLLLWSAHTQLSRGERGGSWVAGLSLGIVLLMGAPDLALASWLMASLWGGVWCVFSRTSGRWRRWLTWSPVTLGVALLVSAIQWIPSVAWAFSLDRPWSLLSSPEVPGALPADPVSLMMQLLQPEDAPAPPLGFVGAVGALLALPALAGRRRRAETLAFAAVALALMLAVALDAGRDLPGLNAALLLYLFPLPAAALAGIGAGRVLAAGRDPRAREVLWPSLACMAAWVALVLLSGGAARGWLIAAAPLLLVPMLLRVRWISVAGGIALALLLFTELATTSSNYYTHPLFASGLPERPALDRAAALALDGRVLLLTDDAPELAAVAAVRGVRTMGGGRVPARRASAEWLRAVNAPAAMPWSVEEVDGNAALAEALRRMDVRVVLAPGDAPPLTSGKALRFEESAGGAHLYTLDTPGRVQWHPVWQAAGSPAEALAQLVKSTRESPCLLEPAHRFASAPPVSPAAPPETSATTSILMDTPGFIEIAVTAPSDGVLVHVESLAPGWSATVDGKSSSLYRVNRLFKGVWVPQGEHRVAFRYRPWPLYLGVAVSSFALLALCGGLLREIFRKRPA